MDCSRLALCERLVWGDGVGLEQVKALLVMRGARAWRGAAPGAAAQAA
jgi:hypothetical protein